MNSVPLDDIFKVVGRWFLDTQITIERLQVENEQLKAKLEGQVRSVMPKPEKIKKVS